MSCLRCVDVCPVKDTLEMKLHAAGKPIAGWTFAALTAGVFVAVTGLAMLMGFWRNDISEREYLQRFKEISSPTYNHSQ